VSYNCCLRSLSIFQSIHNPTCNSNSSSICNSNQFFNVTTCFCAEISANFSISKYRNIDNQGSTFSQDPGSPKTNIRSQKQRAAMSFAIFAPLNCNFCFLFFSFLFENRFHCVGEKLHPMILKSDAFYLRDRNSTWFDVTDNFTKSVFYELMGNNENQDI
jgi:hypothetical protein